MLKSFSLILIVTAFMGFPAWAQSSAKLQQQEIVRRQELVFRATQAIGEAQKAESAKNLAKAQENYRFALANLTDAPATRVAYSTAVTGLTRVNMTLYAQARENGDAKTAKLLVEEIVRYNPQHGPANAELEKIKRAETDPNDTSLLANPALSQDFRKDVETVESLYTEAEQFRRTGQYDEATNRLKKILAIDPYNKTAQTLLTKIAKEKRIYAEKAQQETREKALAEVESRWSEPVKRDVFSNIQSGNPIPITRSNQFHINQKLRSIIIPSLEFRDASIEDAVAFLNAKSKELDPEKQGINFILRPDVPETAKTFTLSLRNVPMEQALRYISQLAGVKYKVEEFAVLVVRLVDNTEVLLRRQFNVPPSFFPSTAAAPTGAPAPTGVRRVAAPVVTSASAGVAEVKEALESMGVEFPPGSTAVYLPASGILQVQNAQAQLDLIQALVEAQGGQALMVDVSVKLVEITQEDLNDLTFNYAYNSPIPIGTSPGVSTALRGSQGFTVGTLDQLLLANTGANAAILPNRLDLTGILDGGLYNVVMTALAQKRSTDLLSSPSLRVRNGEDAKINVSRTFFYPTAFDPPETAEVVSSGISTFTRFGPATIIPAFPNEFESRDIGVKLTVRPQVGADNRTIDLSLLPEVTDFEGFVNYGSSISVPTNPNKGDVTLVQLTPNFINQPIFNTRKVNTKVFVQDGSTVLLAGLIREDVQEITDKVPILGDIPLVGRLFQSKANRSLKKNLLIFVTTRILRPDGDPFNQPESEVAVTTIPGSGR
jgi:general secretion pathway protein D